MHRRQALRLMAGLCGGALLSARANSSAVAAESSSNDAAPSGKASKPGVVHVVVFSNFEGNLQDAQPALRWFDACTAAHPAIVWTHMYNPIYLVADSPEMRKAEATITPYLRDMQSRKKAEVGLHLHCFYDLVRRLGVSPRGYPYASDTSAGCNDRRDPAADRLGGYDVLMTGYTRDEQAAMLDASLKAFADRGFERPTSFCAGYSAADPTFQAVVADKGFRVSFSAQSIPPNHYGTCWERLLKWSGHITPLSIPYRVSRNSILPPPHTDDDYLDLVEVPLNMGVDANDLYLQKSRVTRADMFDRHHTPATRSGRETAVCIGVHAEVVAGETWEKGPVSEVMDRFLTHVERRAKEGGAEIRYGTVSEVAARFRDNKSSSDAHAPS
jgi:hypothetical protein